jgi:hypothetical protein
MDALLEELEELDPQVKRALVAREGDLGAQLRFVEHYELGRLDQLDVAEISPLLLRDAYLHAVEWADATSACLTSADAGPRRSDPLRRAS